MYIKHIRLKGFRTYKDLSVFSFSPGYNAIVGLNGSGKSNILLAISFVLAENMEHVNRSYYLYKGDESSMTDDFTAFVELILDTSHDATVPTMMENQNELCLKRIFSKTKDVYIINGKQYTCKEYRQYLESINLIHFSKNSPSYRNDLHFIVKQGAVGKICCMTAHDRLNAFRDVIGHRSFDAKMEDSLKLLRNSKITFNSIENQINQISRKLQSLDLQRDDMLKWQELDVQRKRLQANLVILKIQQLDDAIELNMTHEDRLRSLYRSHQEKVNMLDANLYELRSSFHVLDTNKIVNKNKAEIQDIEQKLCDLTAESKDLENEINLLKYNSDEYKDELSSLNQTIDATTLDLNSTNERLNVTRENIFQLESKLNNALYRQRNPQDKGNDIILRLEKLREAAAHAQEVHILRERFQKEKAEMDAILNATRREYMQLLMDQQILVSQIPLANIITTNNLSALSCNEAKSPLE